MTGRIKVSLLAVLIGMFALAGVTTIQTVFASGETISAGATATTEIKEATPITGISINGEDDSTVPVKLLVTSGTLSMTTTTGLSFTNASGTPLSNPQTGATLYFSGTRSNVNNALATLRYTRNTTGTDTLEMSLVNPGEVFFSGTGHLYEYVSSTLDWNNAKTAAEGRTKYGATGYLATITSQEENDFVSERLLGAGWMGASDVSSEGTWRWVTGPESGTTFSNGNAPGMTPAPGQYQNWNSGEPNDAGGEDCGQFLAGGTGKWNDLPCSGTTLAGYVVEYGASGDMPNVAAANIDITTSDTVAPTTPGTPSITSPTIDTTPAVSWTASTDGGTGLNSPAYTVEWSSSSSFASIAGSATTNSTSLSPSSGLADGTWYFRVKATDGASNVSTSATSGAVIIDTTAPTTPGTPSVDSLWTNDNTPTWDWTPSVDNGVGLAYIAYGVEWSQDTDFFGLGGTAGVLDDPTYTIPDGLSMTDGTWYFRVKGIDVLGHESAWSSYGTVHVDTVAPIITRSGASPVTVVQGATYTDAGATASDASEGDITESIVTNNPVNSNVVGDYTVTYNVTDSAGNVATAVSRAVQVVSNADLDDDGVADAVQQNVEGTVNTITGDYVVAKVDNTCSLSDVSVKNQSDLAQDGPYEYPVGLLDFVADCGVNGYTTTVTQYYYAPPAGDFVVRKYMNGAFQTINDATVSRQTINDQDVLVVSYPVTDGGERDADGVANGVIVDPAGPAVLVAPGVPNTGFGPLTAHTVAQTIIIITPLVTVLVAAVIIIKRHHKLA